MLSKWLYNSVFSRKLCCYLFTPGVLCYFFCCCFKCLIVSRGFCFLLFCVFFLPLNSFILSWILGLTVLGFTNYIRSRFSNNQPQKLSSLQQVLTSSSYHIVTLQSSLDSASCQCHAESHTDRDSRQLP